MLRFLTAGESHGQALVVIVEGLPAGLPIVESQIQAELARRRLGFGRGPRMRFEVDEITLPDEVILRSIEESMMVLPGRRRHRRNSQAMIRRWCQWR